MPDKSAIKSAGQLETPAHGKGKLRRGSQKGNTPGTGRPPTAFKDFVRKEIREAQASRDALVRASQDDKGRNFKAAWDLAADYDDEKPAQKTDLTSKGEKISGVIILPATEDK